MIYLKPPTHPPNFFFLTTKNLRKLSKYCKFLGFVHARSNIKCNFGLRRHLNDVFTPFFIPCFPIRPSFTTPRQFSIRKCVFPLGLDSFLSSKNWRDFFDENVQIFYSNSLTFCLLNCLSKNLTFDRKKITRFSVIQTKQKKTRSTFAFLLLEEKKILWAVWTIFHFKERQIVSRK